jgi:hypothetical protein
MNSQGAELGAAPTNHAMQMWWCGIGRSPNIFCVGIIMCAATHVALFAVFLVRTLVSSPISDMFTYIQVYLQFRAGEMPLLSYLWLAHGEHHLVWIRLLTWLDVELFHTRGIPFVAAATTAIVATALLVWCEFLRAEPGLRANACFGLLGPMLILSAANVTDCSVPINTTYPITVFFVTLALVLFTHVPPDMAEAKYWRLAGVAAAVGASMATAAGLLAWPILWWIAWRQQLNRRWLLAFAGIGIAYILAYAHGLNFLGFASAVTKSASTYFSVSHLHRLAGYVLSFLGLPFTREPRMETISCAIGGTVFLAAASIVLIATFSDRLNSHLDRFAVGLILLGLGSAALAAVGRGDMIEDVKIPVRYTIFVSSLQIGLLCILLPRAVRYLKSPGGQVVAYTGCLLFALSLLTLQVLIGLSAARIAGAIARDADCFSQHPELRPVSQIVTRWPADAGKVIILLRQQGLQSPLPSENCKPP